MLLAVRANETRREIRPRDTATVQLRGPATGRAAETVAAAGNVTTAGAVCLCAAIVFSLLHRPLSFGELAAGAF